MKALGSWNGERGVEVGVSGLGDSGELSFLRRNSMLKLLDPEGFLGLLQPSSCGGDLDSFICSTSDMLMLYRVGCALMGRMCVGEMGQRVCCCCLCCCAWLRACHKATCCCLASSCRTACCSFKKGPT